MQCVGECLGGGGVEGAVGGAGGLEPSRAGLASAFEGREGCKQVADVEEGVLGDGWWVGSDGVEMAGAYVGGVSVAEKAAEEVAPVPALGHCWRQCKC